MDVLNQLICSLEKEELRYYKIYAKRMVTHDDRKDFQLLDYIRKAAEAYDEEQIALKLYGKDGKSGFYRLKNRLLANLGDYINLHNTWKGEINELNRHISLFHIFLKRNQYKVALYYLKKAEGKALSADNFEMLDTIYANYLKIAGETLEINPEEYIEKRKKNSERLLKLRETDNVLAVLSYRLKTTQNVGGEKADVLEIFAKTLGEFNSDTSLKSSRVFQTRVYRVASQILLQQHNYKDLKKFLKNTYTRFESNKWFDSENHDTKLQMLTYLVNCLFRLGQYDESLKYAELLGTEINAFNKQWYDKYLVFYYNSLVINYSVLDKQKALRVLDEFDSIAKQKKSSYYEQFLYFNKAMLLHQTGKPTEAIRNIVKLYVNDNFEKADASFKFKIAIAELIMQFDAGDSQSYLVRSTSIKRQFDKFLSGGDFKRERQFIGIMDKMIGSKNYKDDNTLRKQVKTFIESKLPVGSEESEIIKYGQWLSAKWN